MLGRPSMETLALSEERMKTIHSMVTEGMLGMWSKDPSYTLFQAKDMHAWMTFGAVFCALIAFDHYVLNRSSQELTLSKACWYTLFWIGTACSFCVYVYHAFGHEQAFMWMSGYMLEWMLSFDNLFVFHLIFSVYGTPDYLKHRPLYIGICGAVFFRLTFLFIGEYLMHAMVFMHLVFGAFLVYTGVQTLAADDDDEDPSKNEIVQWLQKRMPFIDAYDKSGAFFVSVPVDAEGEVQLPPGQANLLNEAKCVKDEEDESEKVCQYGAVDFQQLSGNKKKIQPEQRWQTRATMLFLVVCCLEVSDMIFAVDSVSAIVAQVPDLYLAYTSAVFAMLGLRATFFIIDVLVHMFTLLKYGVSAVLIFIGVKLMISHVFHIPAAIVCLVLVSCISLSIVASVIKDEFEKKAEGQEFDDVKERLEKVTERSPFLQEHHPPKQPQVVQVMS